MTTQFINMLAAIIALIAGGLIGVGFGLIQDRARRRNEKRQIAGQFSSGWAAMPGSGMRVAGLVVVLVLVQVFCPMLFTKNDLIKWWVSGGVAAGYGLMLGLQLRARLSGNK
jgi:putative copper export protein